MDWIAARYVLSTILGMHPLVVLNDDGDRRDDDDKCFPVIDDDGFRRRCVAVPATVRGGAGGGPRGSPACRSARCA
jgi:hypothetical protein